MARWCVAHGSPRGSIALRRAARIAGGFPDRGEDGDDLRGIGRRSVSRRPLGGALGAVEQGQGVRAMRAGRGAESIGDGRFCTPGNLRIAWADGTDIVAAGSNGHRSLRGGGMGQALVKIFDESTMGAPVRF
jgi:hypothetical protein